MCQLVKYLLTGFIVLLSTQIYADLPRFDDGARWAFISEKDGKQIAVIDTFEYKLAGNIELQTVPTEMAVSDIQDILVYIDGKTPEIFIYDLVKHSHSKMVMENLPTDVIFHSDGAQLAVASNNRIDIIKPLTQEHVTEITSISSPFNMNYDNGGYNLYATESNTGKTLIYRNHDAKERFIQMGKGAVSAITLSPDARLALVSQLDSHSVFIWDLFAEAPLQSVSMSSQPWRPYVSSNSEFLIFVDQKGLSKVVNAWSGKTVAEFDIHEAPKSIRTGWLETIGVIESEKYLNIFTLSGKDKPVQLPLKNPLNDVVVVSDSKTLFATQEQDSQLFVYDIRSNKLIKPIDTGLKQPEHLVMGITNTICH